MALDYVQANGIASQSSYPYTSTNLTDQVEVFFYFKMRSNYLVYFYFLSLSLSLQPAACKVTTKQTYATVLKYYIVDSDEEAIRQAVDEYG